MQHDMTSVHLSCFAARTLPLAVSLLTVFLPTRGAPMLPTVADGGDGPSSLTNNDHNRAVLLALRAPRVTSSIPYSLGSQLPSTPTLASMSHHTTPSLDHRLLT